MGQFPDLDCFSSISWFSYLPLSLQKDVSRLGLFFFFWSKMLDERSGLLISSEAAAVVLMAPSLFAPFLCSLPAPG